MTREVKANRLINDDAEEAIVAEARIAPLPDTPDPPPSPTRNPRRVRGKGSYPGRRQVTAYIPKDLFMGLKAISARTERPMVEIFEQALDAYVKSLMAQKMFRS